MFLECGRKALWENLYTRGEHGNSYTERPSHQPGINLVPHVVRCMWQKIHMSLFLYSHVYNHIVICHCYSTTCMTLLFHCYNSRARQELLWLHRIGTTCTSWYVPMCSWHHKKFLLSLCSLSHILQTTMLSVSPSPFLEQINLIFDPSLSTYLNKFEIIIWFNNIFGNI